MITEVGFHVTEAPWSRKIVHTMCIATGGTACSRRSGRVSEETPTVPGVQADSSAIKALTREYSLLWALGRTAALPSSTRKFPRECALVVYWVRLPTSPPSPLGGGAFACSGSAAGPTSRPPHAHRARHLPVREGCRPGRLRPSTPQTDVGEREGCHGSVKERRTPACRISFGKLDI